MPGQPPPPAGAEAIATHDASDRTEFPCSTAQERFWLLDRLDPGNASYNVAVRWRLEGPVSSELLERAWLHIIARHEILRTLFAEVDGAPVQRVQPRSSFRLVEHDLGAFREDLRQAEADRIGVIEARAPFDLGSGPLIRATLLRFSPTLSIILVTTHQIVSDGWSIGVMAREMGVIYDALKVGAAVALEELPIQYADYSLWQLEWLRVRGIEAETAYWTKQLAGVKSFKVLPDRPRPSMPTTNGAIASFVLPRELTNRAQSMGAELGATMFATVVAALCAVLARFTGEEEIVIGTQVSDRDQVELEPMIGQFVSSLILRNDLEGDPSFGELVGRVKETSTQAIEHRHIPIERLLGMIKGDRSHASSAPISVNFIFQKTFIHNTTYSDFALIDMPSLPAGAIYDLNFFMVERPDGWRFSCQYNTDQFEGETADRLLAYFQRTLDSGISDPKRRVSELILCSPSEVKNLLGRLNDTRSLYPRDLTLAKIFETHVLRARDAVSVTFADRQMTYGELDLAADSLARYLSERGVVPHARVGVCLGRCLELPIAILAILKAGATVVPLDPADAPARRSSLLAAVQAVAVIVDQNSKGAADPQKSVLIDVQAGLQAGRGAARLIPPIAQEADAPCLIVASGVDPAVTVTLSHRNLSNLVYSIAKRPGISDRDVLVATSAPGRDRAVAEILLPLLTGARLLLAADADIVDGRRLLHLLQRNGATMMHAAPDVWTQLTESEWVGAPALKMLCSGLELTGRLADRLLAKGGELWTLFGYPETGIWSCTLRLTRRLPIPVIGEPTANTTLYVLDGKLKAALVGATGHLFIAGDGVPDARVGADPLGTGQNLHLRRTGDLARLRATGQIEYLGRSDEQFHHQGVRVDPAQIERLLLGDARIAQAAVIHLGTGAVSAGSIVAYVAPQPGQSRHDGALVADLRARLASSLSHDLVPAAIVVRDSLPLLPEGRADRRALEALGTPLAAESAALSGETEQRLAEIWAPILKVETKIAATDNFFELGGHSLLAARMLTQVERAFGRRIRLATLFTSPTIRELAKVLAQTQPREFDFRQMVKIQPSGSKPPLIGINNTGIYYGLAKCLGEDQPVISLQLFDPSVRTATVPDTLEQIAAGYVELIGRVQPQGPYGLMGWCAAGALAFEIARQLKDAGKEVSNLFLIDSWVPRYLSRQPPLRALIGDYTLRWQLILVDWRKLRAGEKSFSAFWRNRMFVKDLSRLFRRKKIQADDADSEFSTLETYDEWLLSYLQRISANYEPRRLSVRITLLRSREEPTGWFFRKDAGWAEFSSEPLELAFVDGNHFTMFKQPGVAQMARHMANSIELTAKRATSRVADSPS